MSQLILENLSLSYGNSVLLDRANLVVESGERLCLVGRNGAGKSTLLNLIAGKIQADHGVVGRSESLRLSFLEQQVPQGIDLSVRAVVEQGHEILYPVLTQWHALIESHSEDYDQIDVLQRQIEAHDGWRFEQQVDRVLSQLQLDGNRSFKDLSGGWRRRVLLARALVKQPHILLLDEPTNHLDVEAIVWLEQFVKDYDGSVIFISHDRSFIDAIATRIVELDRGVIRSFQGDYQHYLDQKEMLLEQEAVQNRLFDQRLAQEEVWIRQGIKARRTRNEGRVRALEAMRLQRSQRRVRQGSAGFSISQAERSGKSVLEVTNLNFGYPDAAPLVTDFNCLVERGDKIALIGPNGVGKTTLIKLILGEIAANSGEIVQGTKLQVTYFDQTQETLDPERSVLDTVAEGNDQVQLGDRSMHIYSYLQEFLFTPEQARAPIKSLSGGERNRVMLARLFTKSFNFLVMDEPTNDLDLDTLELLEEQLSNYTGTLLLVSHDRHFIDDVVTQSWVFEGGGKITEWVGGYTDWQQHNLSRNVIQSKTADAIKADNKAGKKSHAQAPESVPEKALGKATKAKKLSYKDQREYDQLPGDIEKLEAAIAEIEAAIAAPDFYDQSSEVTMDKLNALSAAQRQLDVKVERWLAIELLLE
jgi:ATP-binding cassette subfamily F protein uup